MSHISISDLLWITVDLDAGLDSLKVEPEKLMAICAEKLISDVSLVKKYCLKLPKSIHLLILSIAVAKRRPLSVEQLMRFCPHRTLELPVPNYVKFFHPFIKNAHLEKELMDFNRISMIMLSVFFDLIKKNSSNSELQTLNLGFSPLGKAALVKIHEFIFKERRKIHFLREYTLKCTVSVEDSTDLHMLRACAEKSTSLGFYLNITGIYFYNDFFVDVEVLKLFHCLEKSNLQLMAFIFANIIPNFDPFFNKLKSFKFVKYLNLSYMVTLSSSGLDARKFALGLTELTSLQRLVLKGINLNSVLSILLSEYCKRKHGVSAPNCCFIHSGSLCYLDISSCNLSDRDLEFLKEISVTNSLKNLDISENSLHEKRTFEILLFLKSSLQTLNIRNCFKHFIDYDNSVMPFSAFNELKYLNISELHIPETSKHLLRSELEKMSNLKILEISFPIYLARDVTVYF